MRDLAIKTVIFITGLGSPASLYQDYLDDLQRKLPQARLLVLEWWNQNDFGMHALESYIDHSDVMLIAHSGGSVIALQTLEIWPEFVKKIVMLDSHFLSVHHALPTVDKMLDIMLISDEISIQTKVRSAYSPILNNDAAFIKAFNYAIQWVDERFEQTRNLFTTMKKHSALFIGFTNSGYQMLNDEEKNELSMLWKKFNVDVVFFPINHFGLIENKYADAINQVIESWSSKY